VLEYDIQDIEGLKFQNSSVLRYCRVYISDSTKNLAIFKIDSIYFSMNGVNDSLIIFKELDKCDTIPIAKIDSIIFNNMNVFNGVIYTNAKINITGYGFNIHESNSTSSEGGPTSSQESDYKINYLFLSDSNSFYQKPLFTPSSLGKCDFCYDYEPDISIRFCTDELYSSDVIIEGHCFITTLSFDIDSINNIFKVIRYRYNYNYAKYPNMPDYNKINEYRYLTLQNIPFTIQADGTLYSKISGIRPDSILFDYNYISDTRESSTFYTNKKKFISIDDSLHNGEIEIEIKP
jgi:hypothetical protein